MTNCIKCKKDIVDNSKYCTYCGVNIEEFKNKRKKIKKILLLVGSFLGLLVLALLVYISVTKISEMKHANSFNDATTGQVRKDDFIGVWMSKSENSYGREIEFRYDKDGDLQFYNGSKGNAKIYEDNFIYIHEGRYYFGFPKKWNESDKPIKFLRNGTTFRIKPFRVDEEYEKQ